MGTRDTELKVAKKKEINTVENTRDVTLTDRHIRLFGCCVVFKTDFISSCALGAQPRRPWSMESAVGERDRFQKNSKNKGPKKEPKMAISVGFGLPMHASGLDGPQDPNPD